MLDITTERDDNIRQTIMGSYGLSRQNWSSKTKFMDLYERLSMNEPTLQENAPSKKGKDENQPNSRDLLQAKIELEYQIELLHKHKNDLSSEGNNCARQLLLLLDEAHSVMSNAFYQGDYEQLNYILNDIIIDKQALLEGIIKQIIIFIENKSRKTGNKQLFTDIQKIKRWKID